MTARRTASARRVGTPLISQGFPGTLAALLAAVPRSHEEIAEIDGLRGLGGLAIFAVMAACSAPGQVRPDARDEAPPDASVGIDDAAPDAKDGNDGGSVTPTGRVLYAPGQRHSPLPAAIALRLQAVAGPGTQVFAKVGDSITTTSSFLSCFDGGSVDYGAHGALAVSVDHFLQGRIGAVSPFARVSEAAKGGWTTEDVLEGAPCGLEREIAAATPGIAFVLLGTNDNRYGRTLDDYVADLWTTVDQLLMTGAVPVLSTLPTIHGDAAAAARVPLFNAAVRAIAQGRQVPLVDLNGVLAPLPNDGLAGDGLHPTVAPAGGCVLTSEGLQYGYNARNLVTIEALARVQAALAGTASDASAPIRAGQGTAAEPFRMPLPISDVGDVRTAAPVNACGSTVDGVVYEIDLGAPATIKIDVIGAASTIEVVANGACVAQGSRALSTPLAAGPSSIIIRGSGEYVVLVR